MLETSTENSESLQLFDHQISESMQKQEALFNDERLEWLKDRLTLGLDLKEVTREQFVEVLTNYNLARQIPPDSQ